MAKPRAGMGLRSPQARRVGGPFGQVTGATPTVEVPPGSSEVLFTVTNESGLSDTDVAEVRARDACERRAQRRRRLSTHQPEPLGPPTRSRSTSRWSVTPTSAAEGPPSSVWRRSGTTTRQAWVPSGSDEVTRAGGRVSVVACGRVADAVS